jgi:hypothetical protein
MKKVIAVAVLLMLCIAFAAADTSNASLVVVKKTHQRVIKHHAHKAGKHHTPKRRHRTA